MSPAPKIVEEDDFATFLKEAGWGDASVTPLTGDAGLRRYFRLEKESDKALLMDMSRAGYEAGLEAYLTIAKYLEANDIRVPRIYAQSLESGLAVIEDMGAESFGDIRKSGKEHDRLYEVATDILIKIRTQANSNDLKLESYKDGRIFARLIQFVDFYKPAVTKQETTDDDRTEFRGVWTQIENSLPPCPMGFCHADYHLENLVWRPESDNKYGLIDFQDAFWGFAGYDLLNLLEDARVSVPEALKAKMKDRFCAEMDETERAIFDDWYVVLSAHFHCRVIGLFVKLYVERGMDQYLVHIPRLQAYIKKNLENPVLSPLKEFVEKHNISLDISPV